MDEDKLILITVNILNRLNDKDLLVDERHHSGTNTYIKNFAHYIIFNGLKKHLVDENAETLEDNLRDEHRPVPEEREDANLFETMAEKFKPKFL